MRVTLTSWIIGTAILASATGLGFAQALCGGIPFAACAVEVALEDLEGHVDWSDPDAGFLAKDEVGALAIASYLLGREDEAREALSRLPPWVIGDFFSNRGWIDERDFAGRRAFS